MLLPYANEPPATPSPAGLFCYKANALTLGVGKAFQTPLFVYTIGKLFLEAL